MNISGLPILQNMINCGIFLKTSVWKLVPRNTKLNFYSLSATTLCARRHIHHGGVRLGFH